uniref:Membrane/secreted protein n=1 Tax=uncultured organism TaxID=155900 RepID=M1PPN4_9ZZZZ|nr:membrane/secreted protein [uncultured organism]
MKLKEKGISPVVGTILLVAVTVIIAGTIAAFVMGLGTPSETPTASITASDNTETDGFITVTHEGGDALEPSKLRMTVDAGDSSAVLEGDGGSDGDFTVWYSLDGQDKFSVGYDATIDDSATVDSGETVTVSLYDTESGGKIAETSVTES